MYEFKAFFAFTPTASQRSACTTLATVAITRETRKACFFSFKYKIIKSAENAQKGSALFKKRKESENDV